MSNQQQKGIIHKKLLKRIWIMNDNKRKNKRAADDVSDYVIALLQKYMIICSCDDGENFLVPSMLKNSIADLKLPNFKHKALIKILKTKY